MPDLISYDRGIHLRATPLWFDSHRRKEHAVLTSLIAKLPPRHARVLAPMALANTLSALGYKPGVLPAPWDKWVVYGAQKLKFLDFGGSFGTGGALVSGAERVLVGGILPIELNIQWQPADHLVLCLPALNHRGAALDQVAVSAMQFVAQAQEDGVSAGIVVDSLDVGHALSMALREVGALVRPLGLLGKAMGEQNSARQGIRIALVGASMQVERRCWIDSGLMRSYRNYLRKPPDATFRLKWYADFEAVKRAIRGTGASRISLIGTDSRKANDLSTKLGGKIMVRGLSTSRQLELAS